MREQDISDSTWDLQQQEGVRSRSNRKRTSQKLRDYLRLGQAYWYWATIILALVTALLVFIIPENAFPLAYLRYILGSIFVLWLPGYTFIKALFPRKEIDSMETVALSIGMSLALVSITGLLLNYTPWGIRLGPITLSLLALTCTLATAALIREHQITTKTLSSDPNARHIEHTGS